MARWYLTKEKYIHDKASKICENAGLISSGLICNSDYSLQAFKKRAVDNKNFLKFENGDWICSAGTIICNGKFGFPILEKIYKIFSRDGIKKTRESIIGHYVVAIKCGDSITIFTDPQGAFRFFYTLEKPWIFSNSLHVMAECIPTLKVDPIKLIAHSIQLATTGEDTFINGIKRLFGFQKLKIAESDEKIVVSQIKKYVHNPYAKISSISDIVNKYKKSVQEVFNHLVGIDSIALNATGGLDTRFVLAGLLNRNIQFRLIYGVGNSELTNTKKPDLDIGIKLANFFGLEFYKMDWSDNHPHDKKTLRKLFNKYGFQYDFYSAPQNLINELEGVLHPYPVLQLGGYSPAFTNMKLWEHKTKDYTFQDLIKHYIPEYLKISLFEYQAEYYEMIKNEVKTALKNCPGHSSNCKMPLEEFVYKRLYLYIRPEARALNFFNEFCYYLAPFLLKRLYDPLLNIPFQYRQHDQFQIRLIHTLYPKAFDIPIFSGLKPAKIDLNTFLLKRPYKYRLKSIPRNLIYYMGKNLPEEIVSHVKPIYKKLMLGDCDESNINDKIRKVDTDYVLSDEIIGMYFKDVGKIPLRQLNHLKRNSYGVETIGFKVKN